MASQCSALYLSDERRCTETATSLNGLFCQFHSRQCQGLYRGYKRRNAHLDSLIDSPPEYLAKHSAKPISQITFADVEAEDTLKELHDHLYLRYALLDRVIRARKLHHSRFFALSLDYGHQHYLDHLSSSKHQVMRALERLERRTAEVLYNKQKWFKWVRGLEDEEEEQRDAEKKKVKQEAALFKRHMKVVESRMKTLRKREDERRQAEFLDKVYQERQDMMDVDTDDDAWDPIEDVHEDERGTYVDLIRHFLWQAPQIEETQDERSPLKPITNGSKPVSGSANGDQGKPDGPASKNAKKKARQKANKEKAEEPQRKPGEVHIETSDEMRVRLREGVNLKGGAGWVLEGTIERPTKVLDRTPPIPDTEIGDLLDQIREIKELLFCRLLLSHAALLPAAIRASSIQDFLMDEEVTNTDLRDLCLKVEQPGPQELRDACADLGREEDEEDEDKKDDADVAPAVRRSRYALGPINSGQVPRKWVSKRESELRSKREATNTTSEKDGNEFVDFGVIDDHDQYRIKRLRVKVCGKYIYNYPSDKAMTRGGWLHFSIIAKDCSLFDAIQLCRNWDEFYELNILTRYQYFPASNWALWLGDRPRQQVLSLGFIPYYEMDAAERLTSHHQTGSRAQGSRRSHDHLELRNFVCAHVKRNDPVTRRFIQYVAMQSCKMALLVRDGKTGQVLFKPPEEQLWLVRQKSGYGRAAKNDWNIVKSVGPSFFEDMEENRRWHFSFKEYFDITIWDVEAGNNPYYLFNNIQDMLIKAHRFTSATDFFNTESFVLKTITMDKENHRSRDIKPGEDVKSIWDDFHSAGTQHFFQTYDGKTTTIQDPDEIPLYREPDALEDQVLFPEEFEQSDKDATTIPVMQSKMRQLEEDGPNWERFILDLDTDEELPSDDAMTDDGHQSWDTEESSEGFDDEDEDDSDDDDYYYLDDEVSDERVKHKRHDQFRHDCAEHKRRTKLVLSPEDREKERTAAADLVDALNTWDPLGQTPKKMPQDLQMAEEFQSFSEREMAATFKDCWHKADLEPQAQEHYAESTKIVAAAEKFYRWEQWNRMDTAENPFNRTAYVFRQLAWLQVDSECHRRIVRDMQQAFAMVSLFFQLSSDFFTSEAGLGFKSSLLFNQTERAKHAPNIRTSTSNKYLPKSYFQEWESISRVDSCNVRYVSGYPTEWQLATRPILAKLYKERIIQSSYKSHTSASAVAIKEPGRDVYDLYFDWRNEIRVIRMPRHLEDPTTVEPLAARARRFAEQNHGARFAVLQLWSAPHFYTSMLGPENRSNTSFQDHAGRIFEWKFMPKDMPYSEWSIHHSARARLEPYQHILGHRVLIKRDKYLVMGTDEMDLLKYASAVVFAITTKPWRLEVDWWKSWVNVDVDFLEGVEWLEKI